MCWHDCINGDGCPDSGWLSQWRKRTEIPRPPHGGKTYSNGRGLCESHGGPYSSPQCLHHIWAIGHERVNRCCNSHGKSYVWNLALLARPGQHAACTSTIQKSPSAQLMRNLLIAFAPLRRPTNLTLLWPWLKVSLTPPSNVTGFVDYIW